MIFIELIKNQEERKFVENLYKQYAGLMYVSAYCILNNNTLAEDAVQISFERIIKYLHKIQKVSEDKILAYLIVVCKNAAKDLFLENDVLPISKPAEQIYVAKNDDPINKIIIKENLNDLVKIITSLRPIYKDVIILKYFCEFEDEIISGSLGITNMAYRQRLSRARKIIRERFSENDRQKI